MGLKKCDPRVYARCPDRCLCGDVASAIFVEGSPCDLYNERMLAPPMTNADRIRAMSDEEMAEWLADMWDCDLCSEHMRHQNDPDVMYKPCDKKCAAHCLEWLQQPAKEDAT